MNILDALTLGIGNAISTSVLSLWLKEPIASAASAGIAEFLKKKIQDVRASRAGQRQFDRIAERVAESLVELFRLEGVSLDEGGLRAVIDAAAETIDSAPLSAEILHAHDLDPARLRTHYLSRNPRATRDFNEAERALYERLISESSQYIVDIALQMPSFTERTLAEVLRRESDILQTTDKILDEVRRIRQAAQSSSTDAIRFETEYLRAVARTFDRLELFGVDASGPSRRYNLSVAYVSLSVERSVLQPERARPRSDEELMEDLLEDDDREIVPVTRSLQASHRLFVRGPAGSGKTTLLQWLAVTSASRRFAGDLADWNDIIPFFIRLREFAGRPLPRPEEFPGLVSRAIASEMPPRWAHEQLRRGRALVLIDGLDEVPRLERRAVHGWLADLAQTFDKARLVFTSRPHAAEPDWLRSESFQDVELQEMNLADVDAFIEHWHRAVRTELRDEEECRKLDELQNSLQQIVKKSRPIRRLATNPLLCALLCALHRDRRKELPSDRIELYRACCDMFLRRDLERKLTLQDYPQLGDRQKRALLETLAYWMIKNGLSETSEGEVDGLFDKKLAHLEKIPQDTNGTAVRRLFTERSGILRQPTSGFVDFPHRTFQEFMAAQAAVDEGDIGLLVKNADDDQWREVVILAVGLARKKEANRIMQSLLDRGDSDPALTHRLHLLAVECLDVALEADDHVKQGIERRLASIMPPKNLTEAQALATAGEVIIEHLSYEKHRHARVGHVAACVRALAVVGGDSALDALEAYAGDRRKGVLQELLRCAGYFEDTDRFYNRLVPRMDHLESFSSWETRLHPLTALSVLKNQRHLKRLNLYDCANMTSLEPLQGFTNLEHLGLRDCTGLTDLSPLKGLTKLEHIYLNDKNTYNIEVLQSLVDLRIAFV